MPFDSQGNFTRLHSWEQDRIDDIDIVTDHHDAEDDNFADGFNQCFLRSGVVPMKGNLNAGGFKVTRVKEATDDTEAKYAIKGYEDFEMNDNIISTLPNNISAVTATQTIEENPEDLEQYGLAKPVIDIVVTFDDGTEKHLMVGNDTPSGDNTYFMIDGVNTVYTVSDTSVANFLKNRKYFFSRICLPAPEDQNNYPVVKSLLVERKDLSLIHISEPTRPY